MLGEITLLKKLFNRKEPADIFILGNESSWSILLFFFIKIRTFINQPR